MANWRIYSLATGEQIGELLEQEPTPAEGQGVWRVTGGEKCGAAVWSPARRGAVEPTALSPWEILNLFTIAERAAARKLVTAVWPEGHELAGQPVDPDGNVQVLIDSLIASRDPIRLDSSYHQQGVALLQGLGILTAERAAAVLAGTPPQ